MTHLLGISAQNTPALTRSSSPSGEFPLAESSHSALVSPQTPEVSTSQLVQDNRVPVDEAALEANRDIGDVNAEFAMVTRGITFLKPSDTIYDDDKDSAIAPYFISRGPSKYIPGGPPRRKALLIAVRDVGKALRDAKKLGILEGPCHDVEQVKKLLLEGTFGWPSDCFTTLKDDQRSSREPTQRNILFEIEKLVADARPGDQLFLYYAGHGLQTKDIDEDETDGKDEDITTSDGKMITDDVLHEKLAKRIPPGCHLTVLFDCCNSGTGLDLQYNWCDNPSQKPPICKGFIKACPGDIVLLSACEDGTPAQEWPFHVPTQAPARGMFTREVIKSLQGNGRGTVGELMRTVRRGLETAGRGCKMQYPQLSSSWPTEGVLERPLCL